MRAYAQPFDLAESNEFAGGDARATEGGRLSWRRALRKEHQLGGGHASKAAHTARRNVSGLIPARLCGRRVMLLEGLHFVLTQSPLRAAARRPGRAAPVPAGRPSKRVPLGIMAGGCRATQISVDFAPFPG